MAQIRYGARTAAQLEDREVKATSVGAWSTSLTASYETDPDLIAAVLPPPLSPSDQPLVRVSVATVDLGEGRPPFGAGTFAVRATHGDTVGYYPLVMPMTTEQSVIGGRETFGEPKKLGQVELVRDGDAITGTFTRLGVTFVEIVGRVTGRLEPPPDVERVDFYLKFLRAPDGHGLDQDASLVYCRRTDTTRELESVEGEITLRESPFDPVADLPVRRIVSLTVGQKRSVQRGEIVARVPAADVLPYVHQRYDDLAPTGTR